MSRRRSTRERGRLCPTRTIDCKCNGSIRKRGACWTLPDLRARRTCASCVRRPRTWRRGSPCRGGPIDSRGGSCRGFPRTQAGGSASAGRTNCCYSLAAWGCSRSSSSERSHVLDLACEILSWLDADGALRLGQFTHLRASWCGSRGFRTLGARLPGKAIDVDIVDRLRHHDAGAIERALDQSNRLAAHAQEVRRRSGRPSRTRAARRWSRRGTRRCTSASDRLRRPSSSRAWPSRAVARRPGSGRCRHRRRSGIVAWGCGCS